MYKFQELQKNKKNHNKLQKFKRFCIKYSENFNKTPSETDKLIETVTVCRLEKNMWTNTYICQKIASMRFKSCAKMKTHQNDLK